MSSAANDETRESVSELMASWAYRSAWATVRYAPEPWARRSFDALADQVWTRRAGGVDVLEDNLAHVLRQGSNAVASPAQLAQALRTLSREAMRAYFQYWCDVFRLPSMSTDDVRRRSTVRGYDRVAKAADSGQGVVLALPHMGNWDMVGAWLAAEHGPFTTVAERLRPESLHRRFVDYRTSLGMEVLPLTGEGHVFAQLASRLRAGGVVCLLGDRDLTGSGVDVSFFGAKARFPAGPAALAVSTGALLMPVSVWVEREDDFHVHADIADPVDLASEGSRMQRATAGTQALAHDFEPFIAARPADWHMMQRIWVPSGEAAEAMP